MTGFHWSWQLIDILVIGSHHALKSSSLSLALHAGSRLLFLGHSNPFMEMKFFAVRHITTMVRQKNNLYRSYSKVRWRFQTVEASKRTKTK
jgi:hypothetical protein